MQKIPYRLTTVEPPLSPVTFGIWEGIVFYAATRCRKQVLHTCCSTGGRMWFFCDPPFNTRIDGHACGNGSIRHREFMMASGEMSESEFVSFLTSSMRLLARYSTAGSVHFLCADWRHTGEFRAAGKQVYDSFLNLAVWVKNVGGMGSFYRSQHELIFVF